jgi:hypothetical protein
MTIYEAVAYCADGCGRPATTERLISVIPTGDQDFIELVELVCVDCERAPVGTGNVSG